jgi:hypothetical protein
MLKLLQRRETLCLTADGYSGPRTELHLWSQTPTEDERRGAWTDGQEERMATEDLESGPMWGDSPALNSGSR